MRRFLQLEKLILPIVEGFGYVFAGLEYLPQGRRALIRVYIDKHEGNITVDDCQKVSRQVSAVLNVEGSIPGDYTLEVSSPGLDRLLFTEAQLIAQEGKRIAIRLIAPMNGRRNYTGRLNGIKQGVLNLVTSEGEVTLNFADIDQARVVPEW